MPQILAEEQGSAKEEPTPVVDVTQDAVDAEKLSAEPEVEPVVSMDADREAPVEEDEWAVPIKKSKKDKKSKKRASLALSGEDQPAEEIFSTRARA